MAFKDWFSKVELEQALKAEQIEWEHKQAIAKADLKRAKDHLKRMKKSRPPMFRPDPVVYVIVVVMNVRGDGGNGELEEFVTKVPTISEFEAELQAKKEAQALGFVWRGTVSIERVN